MTLYDIWQTKHASDFAAGVALLVRHNPAAVTKNILARLQTLAATGAYVGNYERGKLEYALQRSAASGRPSVPPAEGGRENVANPPPEIPNAPTLTSDRAKELHKEHAHQHALMVTAPDDAARAEHAEKIIGEIVPALDAEYNRLRAGGQASPSPLERGSGGEADNDAPLAPILNAATAADYKKLQSVRSRISTLKKKIKAAKTPKEKAKWETELEIKIAERERLEEKLS